VPGVASGLETLRALATSSARTLQAAFNHDRIRRVADDAAAGDHVDGRLDPPSRRQRWNGCIASLKALSARALLVLVKADSAVRLRTRRGGLALGRTCVLGGARRAAAPRAIAGRGAFAPKRFRLATWHRHQTFTPSEPIRPQTPTRVISAECGKKFRHPTLTTPRACQAAGLDESFAGNPNGAAGLAAYPWRALPNVATSAIHGRPHWCGNYTWSGCSTRFVTLTHSSLPRLARSLYVNGLPPEVHPAIPRRMPAAVRARS